MRFISLFLIFCLMWNSFAFASNAKSLEQVFDDYQFSLAVEWDQKDSKFYEQKTAEFFEDLSQLSVEQGLSQEEVLSFAQKKMGDKKSFEALKLKLSLSKGSSIKDLGNVLKENSKEFYQKGASWSGGSVGTILPGILIGALLLYAVWFGATHECVAYQETGNTICKQHEYTNTDVYGRSYTVYGELECTPETVCTDWRKK
ncbi:MAG: hypothetical protein AB7I27_17410 [Bacteriovoracaceae bacterium]